MPVSAVNSQIVFDALKANGVRLMSALPETWLVHLIRLAVPAWKAPAQVDEIWRSTFVMASG